MKGLLVENVVLTAEQENLDLQAGDVILSVESKQMQTLPDLATALKEAVRDRNPSVLLLVYRQGSSKRFVTFTLSQ
jgi:S1-C subfamily serine protease